MFYGIFSFLLWPIVIIGLTVFFVRRRGKKSLPSQNKEWYLQFALCKEDAVSQLFLLISYFFLGFGLVALNRDLGGPLSWRTILLITSIIGLFNAYYLKTIYTLFFSLLGLTSWWGAQAVQWTQGKDIKASALLAGLSFLALLFYSLGRLHEKQSKFKRFSLVYSLLGIIAITGTLFFLSTKPGIGLVQDMTKGTTFFSSWQLTLSLFVFLASLISVTLYSAMQKLLSPFELLAIFALVLLFGITTLLPQQFMFVQTRPHRIYLTIGNELSNTGILWAIVYNLAVFFESLGLIFSGYLRRETWLINLGAIFLFLLIIIKYFDWFFTFLDKSIFFIGAGILLFVVGWFMEKGRRYMISNIKTQTPQIPQ